MQKLKVDHNEDMYSMHNSDLSAHADDRKYCLLEERLKAMEGQGVLGMDIIDLGLVLELRVPPKFKVPDKYTGTTCQRRMLELITAKCLLILRTRGC